MKPKIQEASAKIPNLQTPKEILPPNVFGKQREQVNVKRPVIDNFEDKFDKKSIDPFINNHFNEWNSTCENVEWKDQNKPFKEPNYNYLPPNEEQFYV